MAEFKSTPAASKRENIQVFVRVRPMNEKERLEKKNQNVVDLKRDRDVVVRDRSNSSMTKTFSFDRAFGPISKQIDVYKAVAQPMIAEVLAGYNCTIFAYGQTGTGKTFTMEGERSPGEQTAWDKDPLCGLVPRVLSHMFDELRLKNMEFTMAVNYLELYNEELIDLLSPEEDNSKLRLFEDAAHKGSVIVQGLTDVRVLDKKQVYDILTQGSKKRQTAATLMNATSSRSHTIFTVTIHIREATEAGEDLIRTGKINLVDLAGSENISRSGATNQRAKEAGNINQSLLTLGRVITALVEKTPHIPYRESKLTRLLQDSLGGKTKTCIVATISPVLANLEESLSTLDYAHRAKSITNRPQINQRLSKQAFIKEYDQEIERLRKDLAAQRSGNGIYVDPDNYNELNMKLDRQDVEILEKIQQIRALEEEKEKREALLHEVNEKLEETTQLLGETTASLQVTEKDRDEKEVLLMHHRDTEDSLKIETGKLLQVTDVTVSDLSKVHEALSKKRVLEDVNKKAATTFSATVTNLLHTTTLETNYHQERQLELVSDAKTQVANTKQIHSDAMDTVLLELANISAAISAEAEQLRLTQHKHLLQISEIENTDLEASKKTAETNQANIQQLASAQQVLLLEQSCKLDYLAQSVAANTEMIKELVKQKFEELVETCHNQKEVITKLSSELETKNNGFAEVLRAEQARNRNEKSELHLDMANQSKQLSSINEVVQTLQTQLNKLSENVAQRNNNYLNHLNSTHSTMEEQLAQVACVSDLIQKTTSTSQANYKELENQTKDKSAAISAHLEQKSDEVRRGLEETKLAQTTVLEHIKNGARTLTSELAAAAAEAEVTSKARVETAKQYSAAQTAALNTLVTSISAKEQQACDVKAQKLREIDVQTAFTQDMLEKLNVSSKQWGQDTTSQLENIKQNVHNFVDSDLKQYMPSGVTPARQERDYPRQLKFTSPAARILARHYAEQERLSNGGDSGMNSPVNSSPNNSSSDLENNSQEIPAMPFVAKQPQAQRRILGSRNN